MKTKNLFLQILILLLFITAVSAFDIPQPLGTVNDFAKMFDSASEKNIADLITQVNKETSVEIAVVTIESLNGIPKEEYSIALANKWGVGKKGKDNGIVILIAKQEHEYRIEIGSGLEGTINDAKAGRIARQVLVPNFKRGEYGKGTFETILAVKGLLENNADVVAKYSEPEVNFGLGSFLFFIVTYIISTVCLTDKKIKWPPILIWDLVTIFAALFYGWFIFSFIIIILAHIFALLGRFGRTAGAGRFGGFSGRGLGGSWSGGSGFGGGGFSGGGAGGKW